MTSRSAGPAYGAIVTALGRTGSGVAAGGRLVSQASTGVVGTPEAGDGFGSALAAGDFDGDGRRDLAVGVPGEDIGSGAGYVTDAGSVQVLRGTTSGTTTGPEPRCRRRACPASRWTAPASARRWLPATWTATATTTSSSACPAPP
ncbi:hypothetical protein GCM10025868_35980 [Angustibacter aerolatus]|uniref:FG-GAP repeat protein n=1 Tax=Angustibacter aerolatus TaxID=1162965 RepID=A0ABQ6JJG4_9ACTN|nr:FG-GAP repeat protein [Angustibacter aerolatus]GMA88348.1 hypothetical protein GCM10025868_35980 [Angustibacter aerolatus]